jgi:hypothetical protein
MARLRFMNVTMLRLYYLPINLHPEMTLDLMNDYVVSRNFNSSKSGI